MYAMQPCRVQRQVWEFDKNLLQQDALPPVGQYKYEVATIMRAMAMDEFLPAVIAAGDDELIEETAAASPPPGKKQKTGAGTATAVKTETQPSSIVRRVPPQRAATEQKPVVGITRKILRKGSRVLQVRASG